jgi:catechol 2,3-dioxygenase-like lactoylglutathione lyase family enzyme
MEQRLSLITLGVSDLERARAFYEALGWTTRAAPDDDVVFFQAGGMIVALWSRARLAEDSMIEDDGGWGGITLAYNVRSPARSGQPSHGRSRLSSAMRLSSVSGLTFGSLGTRATRLRLLGCSIRPGPTHGASALHQTASMF